MEILHYQKNSHDLQGYLLLIKDTPQEWLLADIRLTEQSDKDYTVMSIAELVQSLFRDKEGKIYIFNDREILMLVHWGKNYVLSNITKNIERHLPEGSCQVHVNEPTPEGLAKLEILITYKKPSTIPSFSDIRSTRRENVILVADDDLYVRMLVKKGVGNNVSVHEVSDGREVLASYKIHVPDILLLDIHLPNEDGTAVLDSILAADPKAYVVMLSADSSRENVALTTKQGAKGFLTKPFLKEKLMEYIKKCPTFS